MVLSPGDTPVTIPADVTVATDVLLLLHVPPVVASLSRVVRPTHIDVTPVIDAGGIFTVTNTVAVHDAVTA